MAEILGQHFGARADAEKLSVSAQFRPVVGGRCCGGAELVCCQAECISQLLERLGVVVLDDAGIMYQQPIYRETRMPCCAKIVEIELSIGIPVSLQFRMSRFQNLNTVQPNEASLASFFSSCAFLA